MKFLIIEDELVVAEQIEAQLTDLGYEQVTHASNSIQAESTFVEITPDFLIIDIGLKDSPVDGVALCQRLHDIRQTPSIFLSGYSDDATLAKVKSVPYSNFLVKPCSTRQLYVSIDQAIDQISKEKNAIPQCRQGILNDHFFIKANGNIYEKVWIKDLSWVESVRGGVQLFLKSGKSYVLTASLNSFLLQFQHPDLIRVHRSFLINSSLVTGIKDRSFMLEFKNFKKEVPSSQSYWNDIKSRFKVLRSD